MDDEEYSKKAFYKINDYHKAGINLWDNLIISFDKPGGGLDTDYIDRLVQFFLL